MTKHLKLFTQLAIAGFVVLGVFLVFYIEQGPQQVAGRITDVCKSASDHQTCYEREVPNLYPKYSIPQLFDIVREIRKKDPTYQFCHVLSHKLGEKVVAENPERWIEAMHLNPPDGLCSNGFVHGVIGGRFRAEVLDEKTLETLIPDFTKACESHDSWEPSDLDRAMCYHGMGHLYDFITDADLPLALSLCERTTPDGVERMCREGVFMQIFQPLEPDDFLMIERMPLKPSTTTVRSFCSRFTKDEYEGACLRESWPFFREAILKGTGVAKFCSGQPNTEEETNCYQSATAIIGRMSLQKPEQAAGACNALPLSRKTLCFVTVAQALIEEDRKDVGKAIALCRRAPKDIAEECIASLAGRATYFLGGNSSRIRDFCRIFPLEFQAKCLAS